MSASRRRMQDTTFNDFSGTSTARNFNGARNESQIVRYDFTYFIEDRSEPIIEGNNPEYEQAQQGILDFCEEKCKNYCFQLEKCPTTGQLHFQGRIKLDFKNKIRFSTLKDNNPLPGARWSPTSGNCKGFNYVMKADSRILGPWHDKSFENEKVPWDIKGITYDTLRPYQKYLADQCEVLSLRKIDVIYDPDGNIGKSTICRWLHFNRGTSKCSSFNNYKDLVQFVGSIFKTQGNKPAWIFDMPRCLSKENLHGMYSAIEDIKAGNVCDTRYSGNDIYMDPPRIFIFTNVMPDLSMLSKDKWNLLQVNPKTYELEKYVAPKLTPSDNLNSDAKESDLTKHKLDHTCTYSRCKNGIFIKLCSCYQDESTEFSTEVENYRKLARKWDIDNLREFFKIYKLASKIKFEPNISRFVSDIQELFDNGEYEEIWEDFSDSDSS